MINVNANLKILNLVIYWNKKRTNSLPRLYLKGLELDFSNNFWISKYAYPSKIFFSPKQLSFSTYYKTSQFFHTNEFMIFPLFLMTFHTFNTKKNCFQILKKIMLFLSFSGIPEDDAVRYLHGLPIFIWIEEGLKKQRIKQSEYDTTYKNLSIPIRLVLLTSILSKYPMLHRRENLKL